MKNISITHVSFPRSLFAVVYFFSLECFGCCARAHKAWKSETVPLKRQILDVPPKSPPTPTPPPSPLIFVFTLYIPPFLSFVFLSFSHCVSLFILIILPLRTQRRFLLLQTFCPRQAFQVSFLSFSLNPPFLYPTMHLSIHSTGQRQPTPSSFGFLVIPPPRCMSPLSGKVSDVSSECRQHLQQTPLLVLHAMKLTPSNQLRCLQTPSFAYGKRGN